MLQLQVGMICNMCEGKGEVSSLQLRELGYDVPIEGDKRGECPCCRGKGVMKRNIGKVDFIYIEKIIEKKKQKRENPVSRAINGTREIIRFARRDMHIMPEPEDTNNIFDGFDELDEEEL